MQGEDGTPSTTQRLEGLALSAKSDGLSTEGGATDSAAEPAEEVEADPKVEAESEAVPVSPPAQEEDFLNLLDDGEGPGWMWFKVVHWGFRRMCLGFWAEKVANFIYVWSGNADTCVI